MFCITYDTTCYADLQRAFDSFMRQLRELFGPVLRVRKNKRIVSHLLSYSLRGTVFRRIFA